MGFMARGKSSIRRLASQDGAKENNMPKREETIDFSSFNENVDMKGLMADLSNAEAGTGDFPEIPHGKYEVVIDKLVLTTSKQGNPMMKCQMRIKGGQYSKCCLFYNQVVTNGFGLHSALEFLRGLDAMNKDDIRFEGDFNKFRDLIVDIKDAVDEQNLTFELEYGETDKGFDTFKVTDVFEN